MARLGGLGVALAAVAAGVLTLPVFAAARTGGGQAATAPEHEIGVQLGGMFGSHIGVRTREVTADDVSRLKLGTQSGAVVTEVEPDSPAAKTGVRAGDAIVEFDGERVRSTRELARLIRETPAGRTVKMTVVRDGRRVDLAVTPDGLGIPGIDRERLSREIRRGLEGMDPERLREEIERGLESGQRWWYGPQGPEPPRLYPYAPPGGRRGAVRLGITVEDLTNQLAEYFGVKDGVLVRSVTKDSAAGKAGLRAGDVITSVAGHAVHSAADVTRALSEFRTGDEVELSFVRDHKTQTLKVRLDPPYRVRPATLGAGR